MLWKRDKLFCEINPTCYAISVQKEIITRYLRDLFSGEKFPKTRELTPFPHLVYEHSGNMIKRAPGVELELQENKAVNIDLACRKLNGIVLHPGELFSFWRTVGKPSKRKGYKEGRVIYKNKLRPGIGGGLCNLGNTVHLMALHSPLEVTEVYHHSDALAPDEGPRVPFQAGTSVSYNRQDLRFRNCTDQDVQLLLWCEGEVLHAELRSREPFPCNYALVEEGHHFRKEGEKYYRVSKIYKQVTDAVTGEEVDRVLVRDNHSEVMFDPVLIPREQLHICK